MRIRFTILIIAIVVSFSPKAFSETEPTSLTLPRNILALRNIRVVLQQGKPSSQIRIDAPYTIETIQTEEVLGRRPAEAINILPIRNGLRLGNEEFKIYGIKLVNPSGRILVGSKGYLDQIQVIREKNGTLTLINEIDIEVYLRGVLPKEVVASWPVEALKAQAVAARTYALFEELYGFNSDFSLTSTVQSQVYGGEEAAQPATNQAVRFTSGEVILFNGQLLKTYFHANCGGRTYRADFVWDVEPNKALMGTICPYGRNVPSFFWNASFSADEISKQLTKAGFLSNQNVRDIQPESMDNIGRAKSIWIRHDDGDAVINANKFRLAIGSGKLKSTIFDVQNFGSTFEFKGRGFGHGVGLCQWGMKEMAEQGKTYKEILQFYYPGSEVKKIF